MTILGKEQSVHKADARQGNFSEILQKTPPLEPFYGQVQTAIDKLHAGDPSNNPMYEIVHGVLSARVLSEPDQYSEWIHPAEYGTVIAHPDFVAIQDESNTLDRTGTTWSGEMALHSLGGYMQRVHEYRLAHEEIFNHALLQFVEADAEYLSDLYRTHFSHYSPDQPENFTLVAIPSPFDAPELWQGMIGLPAELIARMSPWAKMDESGIVLASRIHRDDKPRGHDYFAYAKRAVASGEASQVAEALLLSAQHEGSHGVIDSALITLLGTGNTNSVREGFAGALANDGSDRKPTSIAVRKLLQNPFPLGNIHQDTILMQYRREANYIAGPKLYRSLYEIVLSQAPQAKSVDVWASVAGHMLQTALAYSKDEAFQNLDENQKLSQFLYALLDKLNISVEQAEEMYNALNSAENGKGSA